MLLTRVVGGSIPALRDLQEELARWQETSRGSQLCVESRGEWDDDGGVRSDISVGIYSAKGLLNGDSRWNVSLVTISSANDDQGRRIVHPVNFDFDLAVNDIVDLAGVGSCVSARVVCRRAIVCALAGQRRVPIKVSMTTCLRGYDPIIGAIVDKHRWTEGSSSDESESDETLDSHLDDCRYSDVIVHW